MLNSTKSEQTVRKSIEDGLTMQLIGRQLRTVTALKVMSDIDNVRTLRT